MRLSVARVLHADEEQCLLADGRTARWAQVFPTPRADRVLPGHLVALADDVVVWRWFDAVVLGNDRLWEPLHGEVVATRRGRADLVVGERAWASAGLPGADWWVAGPTTGEDVELDEVVAFYDTHELWDSL